MGQSNFGWGATVPTLIIRIIGFRESDDVSRNEFSGLTLPAQWLKLGESTVLLNCISVAHTVTCTTRSAPPVS